MTLRDYLVIGAGLVVAFNVFVLMVLVLLSIWSTREAPNYWE